MPHLKARLSVSSVRQLSVHSSDSESNQAKDLRMDDTYRLTRSKREPLDIQPQCVTPAAIARAYSVSALAVVALSKVPLALLTVVPRFVDSRFVDSQFVDQATPTSPMNN